MHQELPDPEGIDVLLLDLGGVIIDIDPERTSQAFSRLGKGSILEAHSRAEQDRLFDRLERGELRPDEFRRALREQAGMEASDEAIDEAWNALLLDIPPERYRFLKAVAKRFRLHLFSNTNEIHMEGFRRIVERGHGSEAFRELFEGIHLSYEMGVRKPEERAFDKLLERIGTSPHRILFIDDTLAHIETARKKGLRGYHLKEERITDLERPLLGQDLS